MTAYWCYRCHIAGHPTSAHPVSVHVTWLAEALRRLDFTAYGSLAELPNADTIAAAIVTEYTAVHDRYRRAHDETHDDPEDCGPECVPFLRVTGDAGLDVERLALAIAMTKGMEPGEMVETTKGDVSVLDYPDEWFDTPRAIADAIAREYAALAADGEPEP